jgi:hypothetical protein
MFTSSQSLQHAPKGDVRYSLNLSPFMFYLLLNPFFNPPLIPTIAMLQAISN